MTANAAALVAKVNASIALLPSITAALYYPVKVSPAPVVSTALTVRAG